MKKIAIVSSDMTAVGGAETVTAAMANELSRIYECHLISICNKYEKTPFSLAPEIRYFPVLNTAGEQTRVRDFVLKSRKPIRDYLKKNQIDVVLIIDVFAAATIVNYLFSGKKTVFCDHGALMTNLSVKTDTMIRRINSSLAKKVIVLTEKNKEAYQQQFRIPEKKIDFIYNWVDDKLLRSETTYNENSNRILSMGRVAKIKGPDLLIKTAKKLRERNDNWVWDVYGSGDAFEDFQKWIQEEGLEGWVIPHGMTNDPYGKYPGHAMEVLTSYSEGLPLALLEAKANYLPLVSFDIHTGPSDIITDGIDGYLIEPYNTDRMAEKIDQLLRDKALRKNFSQHARDNLDKFKKETILKKWIVLIESL